MIKITIGENQGNQRLDRFLKKYFAKASLSHVYKLIRKDVKVNGRRANPQTVLAAGDELTVYMSCEEAENLQRDRRRVSAKKQFSVIYEDENILIADKPFGLLTHGDGRERKNHLANQVTDYLILKGEYDPRTERTFTPSPANRLDRNTTGLVIFGKKAPALQELNEMIRERDAIEKIYMTIVSGNIEDELHLRDEMIKDRGKNISRISHMEDGGKIMETEVFPLAHGKIGSRPCTLVKVGIRTGRTHQIRLQLASAGYPIMGDVKYGSKAVNDFVKNKYGLSTQLLHAHKLIFAKCKAGGALEYLQGREFASPLPERFERIKKDIFG